MIPLLKLFWGLCRLRYGPDVLPVWPRLLPVMLVIWALTQMLSSTVQQVLTWGQSFVVHSLHLALAMSVTGLALSLRQRASRRRQTLSALVGVDWVLTLVRILLLLVAIPVGGAEAAWWLMAAFILLLCWELTARGFILCRALETGPVMGISLSLAILILAHTLVMMVMPETMRPMGE